MADFPYPDENSDWNDYRSEVLRRFALAGRTFPPDFDWDVFKWWSRAGYSSRGMTKADAFARHLRELDEALGLTPPPSPKINGQLRVIGQAFADDDGLVLPVLCHFGEAFSAYVRRPDDVRHELDRIAAHYDGIRFWDVLGYYSAWRGKEVTPVAFTNQQGGQVEPLPRYYEHLENFLVDVKQRGMVVHHTRGDLNAMPWDQVKAHCRRVGAIQRSVGASVVALNESCNESWQNGVPDLDRLREMGDEIGPHALRATSAADDGYGGETVEALKRYTWDVAYCHGYRGGQSYDRIRHVHAWAYEGFQEANVTVPGWQGEPSGPGDGVTVGRESNVEALCLMAAMALACKQAWVYMSSHGVFWNGSIADMPGFAEVPRVRTFLPPDVMTFSQLLHGGERWKGTRVFVANRDGTLRCDGIHSGDNRFVAFVYGEPNRWRVPVERSFEGHAIHPSTGVAVPLALRAGDAWDVSFERGRVVVGQFT